MYIFKAAVSVENRLAQVIARYALAFKQRLKVFEIANFYSVSLVLLIEPFVRIESPAYLAFLVKSDSRLSSSGNSPNVIVPEADAFSFVCIGIFWRSCENGGLGLIPRDLGS